MSPWYCACGQESRIVEDRQENGQLNRFCEVCGKTPPSRLWDDYARALVIVMNLNNLSKNTETPNG